MADLFLDDYGTVFEITITEEGSVVDVSTATEIKFIFLRPDKSKFIKTGVVKTTGIDGVVKTTIDQGDLNSQGEWRLQAFFELGRAPKTR